MSYNWRLGTRRGANMIDPQHQRLESADKQRWALGRNLKRSLGDHRFDAVEVWTLKFRGADGKAQTAQTDRDRQQAEAWVADAEPQALCLCGQPKSVHTHDDGTETCAAFHASK